MNNTKLHHFIVEFANQYHSACREYSGRGMFGRKCLAVVTSNIGDFMFKMMSAAAQNPAGFVQIDDNGEADEIKWDSMGHDFVVYFPKADFDHDFHEVEGDEACPSCGCMPGDGVTASCEDELGCKYYKDLGATKYGGHS